MSISFGFKKKIENKVVTAESDEKEETDYLKTVEGKVLKSVNEKPEAKELVIPLIKKNRYANVAVDKSKATKDEKKGDSANAKDELQDEAVKEIILESKNFLDQVEDQNGEEFDNLAVPLLLRNQVPEGFETDERLDVSLRPDGPTDAEYDKIPIEAYGMAVLRGMGWTPEEGIGKTFKQNTKMLEQQVRPKGLGLGADVPAAMKIGQRGNKSSQAKNEADEILELKKGSYVLIHKGSLKNKYGTVQGIDIDTARCFIKLAIGGKSEQVGQHCLRVVSKKEFEKNAKDLSRLSKAYTGQNSYVIGNGTKDSNGEHAKKDTKDNRGERNSRDSDGKRSEREESHREHSEKKHRKRHKHERTSDDEEVRHKKHKKDKSEKKHKKSRRERTPPPTWVRPNMRVRIVDKSYKKGRFFLEKVIVEDVLARGMCSCKTNDGKLLDDLHDSMLETVVPKSLSEAYVIIVRSNSAEHNGKLAKILEKDKEKYQAVLQLIEDRDIVVSVSFDEMCEYTGDVEAHDMF